MSPRARFFTGRQKELIGAIGGASPEVRSVMSIGMNLTQEEEATVGPWPRRGRRRRMNTVLEDDRTAGVYTTRPSGSLCMAMSLH